MKISTLSDTCDEIHLLKKGEPNRMVQRSTFSTLEQEMKSVTIGKGIEKLGLE